MRRWIIGISFWHLFCNRLLYLFLPYCINLLKYIILKINAFFRHLSLVGSNNYLALVYPNWIKTRAFSVFKYNLCFDQEIFVRTWRRPPLLFWFMLILLMKLKASFFLETWFYSFIRLETIFDKETNWTDIRSS